MFEKTKHDQRSKQIWSLFSFLRVIGKVRWPWHGYNNN